MTSRGYWIGVVSRSHVHIGVKGGLIQLNQEKKAPLQRLRAGDELAITRLAPITPKETRYNSLLP